MFFLIVAYGKKKSRVDILDIFAIHVSIAPGIELGGIKDMPYLTAPMYHQTKSYVITQKKRKMYVMADV